MIQKHVPHCNNPEIQKEDAAANLAWFNSIFHLYPKHATYPTNEAFYPDIVCRTLIANIASAAMPTASSCITNFLDYEKYVRLFCDCRPTPIPEEDFPQIFSTLGFRLRFISRGCSLCGRYLGIGPLVMKDGDEVCNLYGASTPFITRERMMDTFLWESATYMGL